MKISYWLIMTSSVIFLIALSCSRQALKNHSLVLEQRYASESVGKTDKVLEPAKPAISTTAPTVQKNLTVETKTLPVLYFDFDRSDIRFDAETALKKIGTISGNSIIVSGHADERGTIQYNQALGMRRAQAVKEWLIDAGVTLPIWCISYGKTRLAAFGCPDEACHQLNRRVEIVVK